MPRDIDWDALTVEADCGGMRWPSQEAAGSSKSRPARPGYAHLPLTIDRRTLETFAEELKRRAPPALVSEPKSALKVNHVDAALVTPPRPKRGLSYRADDEPLLAEMHELIKAGLERTAENAASKVASKAKGKSPAAAAIRLRKAYRRIWPRVESKRGE